MASQVGTAPFQIVQTPSGQSERPFSLSWSHYVFLLGIKKAEERSFYEIESTHQNRTLRELRRQFQSGLYERLALSRDQDGIRQLAQQGQIVAQPKDLLKEPLVLEFLGLSEQARFSESDLEAAIISQIEHFLLELGVWAAEGVVAKSGPSEDSFCRICSPIAPLLGKKTVKNGPLRSLCSRRSFCRPDS